MTYNNAFTEWTKVFGDFKAPAIDVNQIISQYRRNAETTSNVIQIATASTQEIARRQAEILRSNAEQAIKATKEIASNATPENAAAKQADFAKNWLEYNVNSVRELVELGTKSAQEVFEVVNKHISEQVKEFSEAASAPSAAKKKAA
ncbi:MAG TPA: TIGR01841 family phasin [Rickettsiales bacterium]|nr:TIGR01841 family phasin [Rickettsiales bacterium]